MEMVDKPVSLSARGDETAHRLSLTQELQSESVESVNFIEKIDFWQKKEEEEREKSPPKLCVSDI